MEYCIIQLFKGMKHWYILYYGWSLNVMLKEITSHKRPHPVLLPEVSWMGKSVDVRSQGRIWGWWAVGSNCQWARNLFWGRLKCSTIIGNGISEEVERKGPLDGIEPRPDRRWGEYRWDEGGGADVTNLTLVPWKEAYISIDNVLPQDEFCTKHADQYANKPTSF